MRVRAKLAVLALAPLLVAGCGGTSAKKAATDRRLPPSAGAQIIAAMAALPGGGLRVGELDTGVIRDFGGGAVARVAVSTGGQRGLLGLAVSPAGATYAAYTERGGARRIVVAQVAPGPARRVWTGPPSAELANGGHLLWAHTGRLVIGIGDLAQRDRLADPRFPNGKILSLDPAGLPAQKPVVLSGSWNNPYAITETPSGRLWVADNAPGARPERIGPGTGTGVRTDLRRHTAPSGIAAINDRTLAVCGVVSGRLDRYRVSRDGRVRFAGTIARRCTFGVVRRTDGRLTVSTPDGLRTVRP